MVPEAEQLRLSVGGSREAPRDIDRTTRWIRRPEPSRAAIRLLCFPHAGGGASAFANWQAEFPSHIEILPLQYPGRESRWSEPLCGDLAELVRTLAEDLAEL